MSVSLFSHRVGKEEGHIVLNNIEEGESVLKFLVSLITKPTDEIAGKSDTRNLLSNVTYQFDISFSGMVPPHSL